MAQVFFHPSKKNQQTTMLDRVQNCDLLSAFSKTQLQPELQRVLSCKSPAVFLHTPLDEKGPWIPF